MRNSNRPRHSTKNQGARTLATLFRRSPAGRHRRTNRSQILISTLSDSNSRQHNASTCLARHTARRITRRATRRTILCHIIQQLHTNRRPKRGHSRRTTRHRPPRRSTSHNSTRQYTNLNHQRTRNTTHSNQRKHHLIDKITLKVTLMPMNPLTKRTRMHRNNTRANRRSHRRSRSRHRCKRNARPDQTKN